MDISTKHWSDASLKDFSYWILSDFTSQIESTLKEDGISNSTFAKTIQVSPSRVSQVLHDPGNLTVGNVVKYARGLRKKVALVLYDDLDPDNTRGPIHAEVFTRCWQLMGCPQEVFDIESMTQSRGCWVPTKTVSAANDHNNIRKDVKVEKTAAADSYAAAAGLGGDRRRSA